MCMHFLIINCVWLLHRSPEWENDDLTTGIILSMHDLESAHIFTVNYTVNPWKYLVFSQKASASCVTPFICGPNAPVCLLHTKMKSTAAPQSQVKHILIAPGGRQQYIDPSEILCRT